MEPNMSVNSLFSSVVQYPGIQERDISLLSDCKTNKEELEEGEIIEDKTRKRKYSCDPAQTSELAPLVKKQKSNNDIVSNSKKNQEAAEIFFSRLDSNEDHPQHDNSRNRAVVQQIVSPITVVTQGSLYINQWEYSSRRSKQHGKENEQIVAPPTSQKWLNDGKLTAASVFAACENKDECALCNFITVKPSLITSRDKAGDETLLHLAIRMELSGKTLRVLIETMKKQGMSIDIKNARDLTPLYCACRFVHDEAVHLLLDYGASLSEKCTRGERTALHIAFAQRAEKKGHLQRTTCERLLQHAKNEKVLDLPTREDLTVLHYCCMEKNEWAINWLVDNGASVCIPGGEEKHLPLCIAITGGLSLSLIKKMIAVTKEQCALNIQNKKGFTA